jgi:hypothetical protein
MVTADDLSRQQKSGNDNCLESPTDIPALVDVVIELELAGYIDDLLRGPAGPSPRQLEVSGTYQ